MFKTYHRRYFKLAAKLFLIATLTSAANAQEDQPHQNNTTNTTYKSIILKDEEVNWIEQALKSNQQSIPLEILLPKLFPPTNQPDTEEQVEEVILRQQDGSEISNDATGQESTPEVINVSDIYLKSILYFSPNNWTIWLNDQKISNAEEFETLQIIKVSREVIIFLWPNINLDNVFPDWRLHFYDIGDGKYASYNKDIVFDENIRSVSFVLYPNQRLIANKMEIVEGTGSSFQPGGNIGNTGYDTYDNTNKTQEENNAAPKKDSFLNGHNPADGLENMQKYMIQLNALQKVLESQKQKME